MDNFRSISVDEATELGEVAFERMPETPYRGVSVLNIVGESLYHKGCECKAKAFTALAFQTITYLIHEDVLDKTNTSHIRCCHHHPFVRANQILFPQIDFSPGGILIPPFEELPEELKNLIMKYEYDYDKSLEHWAYYGSYSGHYLGAMSSASSSSEHALWWALWNWYRKKSDR